MKLFDKIKGFLKGIFRNPKTLVHKISLKKSRIKEEFKPHYHGKRYSDAIHKKYGISKIKSKKAFYKSCRESDIDKAWKEQLKREKDIRWGIYDYNRRLQFRDNYIKMLKYHNVDKKYIDYVSNLSDKELDYFSRYLGTQIDLYGSDDSKSDRTYDKTNDLENQIEDFIFKDNNIDSI